MNNLIEPPFAEAVGSLGWALSIGFVLCFGEMLCGMTAGYLEILAS